MVKLGIQALPISVQAKNDRPARRWSAPTLPSASRTSSIPGPADAPCIVETVMSQQHLADGLATTCQKRPAVEMGPRIVTDTGSRQEERHEGLSTRRRRRTIGSIRGVHLGELT